MQTTNHSPQTLAHGLASLGRYGDTYMVHAAEGETVIPAEILQANPRLKADLFRQMQMMGIKNPNRYVVGNSLNSLNPVTGQPEFFWKKLKKFVPVIAASIGRSIAGPIGAPLFAAGTAELVGEDPKAFGIGTLLTDVLGQAVGGAASANEGFGNRLAGFGRGLTRGATAPFSALGNLFTAGPSNPIAQGALGSLIMPESAQQFQQLYPDQGFLSPYRTGSDIQARREAALQSAQQFQQLSPREGMYKVSADAGGGMSSTTEQWMEIERQLVGGSRNAGTNLVDTPYGRLTGKQFDEALATARSNIANSTQGISALGSPGQGLSPERFDDLVAQGLARPGDELDVMVGNQIVKRKVPEARQNFMESLTSPSTLGNVAAFAIPAGLAYFAARDDNQDDLTREELEARERAVNPQRVAYEEAAGPSAESGVRPAFAYQGEEGIRRLARSMGLSEDAARRYIGDYGPQYLAGGGEIMGPGTGTSDSIPARLSDGEFVMTADAVRGAGNGDRNMGAARMYDLMSRFEGLS